jgi:hypothetical protein
MRLFEVQTEGVTEGLPLHREPFPHVAVGEEGRGRRLARLPLGRQFAASLGEAERVLRGSVIRTRERGTLLLVEERPPQDARALVALCVYYGYRGSVSYTGPGVMVACPSQGRPAPEIRCERCGALYPASLERQGINMFSPENIHPDEGTVWDWQPLEEVPGCTVLLEGVVAEGGAGRMASGPQYLAILEPGVRLVAHRTGRTYGKPCDLLIAWDGETLSLTPWEEALEREALEVGEGDPV